jgi:hypothetical protein
VRLAPPRSSVLLFFSLQEGSFSGSFSKTRVATYLILVRFVVAVRPDAGILTGWVFSETQ